VQQGAPVFTSCSVKPGCVVTGARFEGENGPAYPKFFEVGATVPGYRHWVYPTKTCPKHYLYCRADGWYTNFPDLQPQMNGPFPPLSTFEWAPYCPAGYVAQ
jgi:hypothetical protein